MKNNNKYKNLRELRQTKVGCGLKLADIGWHGLTWAGMGCHDMAWDGMLEHGITALYPETLLLEDFLSILQEDFHPSGRLSFFPSFRKVFFFPYFRKSVTLISILQEDLYPILHGRVKT
jgi:hypothetical protein